MKSIILSFSQIPFFFFLIYFFSLFFLKKRKFFKIIIIFNTFSLIIFSFPITSYLLKLPLYPKKNIYEENLKEKYSLILVPTAGFKRNIDNYEINKTIPSFGFGITFTSPFGPIDFIYSEGPKTFTNQNETQSIIYFNVGYKF